MPVAVSRVKKGDSSPAGSAPDPGDSVRHTGRLSLPFVNKDL